MAEFRMLGALTAYGPDGPVDVGPPRQRTVLAVLLAEAGQTVPVEVLVDRVWGETPPERARRSLHSHIARLRRLVDGVSTAAAPARLLRHAGGYQVHVSPDSVDVLRFQSLVDRARDPDRPAGEQAALLRDALALWHGEPLGGATGDWAARVREQLVQQRLAAAAAWAGAEVRLGNAAAVIGPLGELAGEHPLVEPLAAAYVLALHAAGRSADALRHYETVRVGLAEALGVDPTAELREAYQAVLRGEPGGAADRPRVPAMLPTAVAGFAGREAELGQLDQLVAGPPHAVPIAVVSGTAGVGKTALALHWAHRSRSRFPDGQLYLNLRGFDPGGGAVSRERAVRILLDALGVPARRIPADLDAQTGLYRSQLAGRRILLVLDNARDASQVRPLLPGSPGVAVVVTSRSPLAGLVATEGARPLLVDLLTDAEAYDLLAGRIGAARLDAEPEAVGTIVSRCARLPLALAIAAARAATHPGRQLAALAAELTATSGLDALAGEDPSADARAVFATSYRVLTDPAARLFRLLGRHPGPDISAPAAASLAGQPAAETRRPLAELTGASLIAEHRPGRYAMHDLLRAYAAELADRVEPGPRRRAAIDRMLDHYLYTTHAAAMLLQSMVRPIELAPVAAGVRPEELTDAGAARRWLRAEHAVLLGLTRLAAEDGHARHVAHLAWSLTIFLDRDVRYHDLATVQRLALEVAVRAGDRPAEATARRNLGRAYERLDRHADAREQFSRALELFQLTGDVVAQAMTERMLGEAYGEDLRYGEAIRHGERALALFRQAGNRVGEASALNLSGWYRILAGEHARAVAECQQAVDIFTGLGDQHGEAISRDSLGYAYHRMGRQDRAIEHLAAAVTLHRRIDDPAMEAGSLAHLGEAQRAAGDAGAARASWTRALQVLTGADHPLTATLEALLGELDGG